MDPQQVNTWKHTLLLSFQSIGVVYGPLSIAPLYVFETIDNVSDFKSDETLYGLLSFMFWTLTFIPLLKYVFIVLRADDNGEGGTFALYSLLCRHAKVGLLPNHDASDENFDESQLPTYEMECFSNTNVESRAKRAIEKHKSIHYLMLVLALFGACMVIADGVLTPSLSVFSASSGLERSLSDLADQNVPIPTACAILIGLFALQRYGTHKIGFMFAPIVIVWLLFISGVGLYNIIHWNPHVITALSPEYTYKFMKNVNFQSWKSLGGVLLCIAGSEAMFADLGHFSKKSIKIAFSFLVYPALIISYMGQTAFISKNHSVCEQGMTYLSASMPKRYIRHVFTVLSLLASAVGSQATITGSFSIIKQCLALGCFPRVKVVHTSDKIHGQVYIPDVNWLLMLFCLTITIGFGDVGRIGKTTGLAIIISMLITTCLMTLIIALYWEKNFLISVCFFIFFGSIELMYLSASVLNVHRAAWYPIVLVAVLMIIMISWHYGTMKIYEYDLQNRVSMEWLTNLDRSLGVTRVPGIGFIYTNIMRGIPAFFSHFVTNLSAFHKVLIFVSFKSVPVPYVVPSRQFLIGRFGPKEYRVYRCILRYGYCDSIQDTDNFEDKLIRRIGEFVSVEENNSHALISPDGRMIVVGNMEQGRNAMISQTDSDSNMGLSGELPNGHGSLKKKKVRFLLPTKSPQMSPSVREELQDLVDGRENGTAYFLGQSHLSVRKRSDFLKRMMITTYIFLNKNCREPSVALNIPHAALVEVGMVYSI
ncbi:potassium transporter 6-like [Tasmannia lanceolata]|uniref:potassium transporter 6-like n=1 Tax=Tasmannia lanceolata TaxID=3420 RepID=UPI0040636D4A